MYDVGSSSRAFQSTSKFMGKKNIGKFTLTIGSTDGRGKDQWERGVGGEGVIEE